MSTRRRRCVQQLASPLLVVPTELTEHTEAYGLIFLESTERIDATRHTTESTEMIACVASPKTANHAIISAFYVNIQIF